MIDEIMAYNKQFVANKEYEPFLTSKYPDKKMAILSCMDARLTALLPAALGIKNGDVKIIKNAGGAISHPFGSAVRSLLVAIYDLGVEEVLVIGHMDCDRMIKKMQERGVSSEHLKIMNYCGIDFKKWLSGFDDVNSSVAETVQIIREHPLFPKDIKVYGFIMDSVTGELTSI
ncbi:MAG: carbonic anhydrase [Oscillospiraceae bacterium]